METVIRIIGLVVGLLITFLIIRRRALEWASTMFGRRLSKGKIDIAIQKFGYAPGDTISGNVTLTLKKPVKAREVSISLIGEAWVTRTKESIGIMDLSFETEKSAARVRIYEFKLPLDGEKEYREEREYHFEIKTPADIQGMRPQTTGETQFSPTTWYLLAKLETPRGLNISKNVEVAVG
jgi:hypothetical protein